MNLKGIETDSIDTIIDKCGLDCLFSSPKMVHDVLTAMKEFYRVLKPDGKVIIVSQGKPKLRKFLLRTKIAPFEFKYQPVKAKQSNEGGLGSISEQGLYMYVCQKGDKGNK